MTGPQYQREHRARERMLAKFLSQISFLFAFHLLGDFFFVVRGYTGHIHFHQSLNNLLSSTTKREILSTKIFRLRHRTQEVSWFDSTCRWSAALFGGDVYHLFSCFFAGGRFDPGDPATSTWRLFSNQRQPFKAATLRPAIGRNYFRHSRRLVADIVCALWELYWPWNLRVLNFFPNVLFKLITPAEQTTMGHNI